MPDANSLVASFKRAAKEEREASKPCDVIFGTVTSASPLQITTEQQLPLGVAQLILTRNVTSYATTATVSWTTSDGATVKGTKAITINNGLAAGEKVVLVRQDGGQKFLVLDRVVALS